MSSRDEKNEDSEEEEKSDSEEENHGAWYQIKEKLGIYAPVVKYLRFEPRHFEPPKILQEKDETEGFDPPTTTLNDMDAPLPLSLSSAFQSLGRIKEKVEEEDFVSIASEIVEDMVLNIAELVVLEYLNTLRNGALGFKNSGSANVFFL